MKIPPDLITFCKRLYGDSKLPRDLITFCKRVPKIKIIHAKTTPRLMI